MVRNEKGRLFVMIAPVCVANNFIKRGLEDKIEITPLKLQKLVYFMFREYLKRTGKCLFTEPFETWTKGPVIPSIYTEFSSYGANPIKTFAKDSQGHIYIVTETGVFKECLEKVWCSYGRNTGEVLSEITHRVGSAWDKAKKEKNRCLKVEDIKNEEEYFA